MNGPQALRLEDGKRLHLHWGPIDLIIEAFGAPTEISAAYDQAVAAFAPVLPALADELEILRSSDRQDWARLRGPVALEMARAAEGHAGFVTPMAGVAGAVADHILSEMIMGRRLDRAYVNNGGDCALYLPERAVLEVAAPAAAVGAKIRISGRSQVRGIATSGWRGRSWSLGIADAVTVLAKSAVLADVAATLIGGAVDLPGHVAITRQKAIELDPDSDLGTREVTTGVGSLKPDEIAQALERGASFAKQLLADGLISGALLSLQGQFRELWDEGFAPPEVSGDSITPLIE